MTNPTLIGDFLHRIKRPVKLSSNDKYKLVTVKLKHKGVVLRGEKLGSEIKSKMYRVMAGDFILSGIDARNGAFGIVPRELDGAIVTNDFWYFAIDEDVVDKHFFLELTSTKWFDEICRKGSDGTTQRIRLQKNKFFNQTVFLPSLDEQRKFIAQFQKIKANSSKLNFEMESQKSLLKKLRQQILQEAIEGKLTADWRVANPDVEPASVLLERITAEKADLIKSKKIKKQKSLPPINDEEKYFALPEGWEWCRTDDACSYIVDCPHSTPKFQQEGKVCIDTTCINMAGEILVEKLRKVSESTFDERNKRLVPKCGDIIYSREGVVGQAVIIPDGWEVCLGQRVMLFRPFSQIPSSYFRYVVTSKFFLEEMFSRHRGIGAKHVNMADLRQSLIPLPPLAEQKIIYERVDKLFSFCDLIEAEITQNQVHTNELMQAVLREAFTSSPEVDKFVDAESQDNIVPFKPKRIDYYKRTLLAAEIVDQLHTEPTLGHLKLQKLIFLCQKTQGMELPTNFLQQAAGPYDPKMARSIDKQLRDKKWYEYRKNELHKYQPLDDAGSHKNDFEKYFVNDLSAISRIINLFRKARSEEMEAVATLYACWEELLQSGNDFSNGLLTSKFYAWSEQKSRFPVEKLEKTIEWMNKNGIVPARKVS